MSGTAVDTALNKLLAVFAAAAPTGWQVVDSQPYDPKRKFLAVGWDASEQPAVTTSRTVQTPVRMQEAVEVSNLLSLWSGKQLTADARTEAFTAFDAFDAALAANRRLDGAVTSALISAFEFTPARHQDGVMAQIRFTVALTTVQ